MPAWLIYSLIASLLAGITAFFVKSSMSNMSTEWSMFIRIAIVFVIVVVNLILTKGNKESIQWGGKAFNYLVLSGITTGLCWIFYYKAIDVGDISVISVIDRGSIVITILLAVAFLGEPFTVKMALGSGLILLGLMVLIWK